MKTMKLDDAMKLAKSVFDLEMRWFGNEEDYLVEPVQFRSRDKRYKLIAYGDGGSEVYDLDGRKFVELKSVEMARWVIVDPFALLSRMNNVCNAVESQSQCVRNRILFCLR